MRYAYGALVLTSLVLHKELGGGPALHSLEAGAGKDGWVTRPPPEGSRQLRFLNTFCPQLGLSWLAKSPAGAHLLGMALLLLWLLVEAWASSRLATWRVRPRPATTLCSVRDPTLPFRALGVGWGFHRARGGMIQGA